MAQEVRVRFAPSPTGYLHVGGARTALYNYLYARQKGGKFILRIEDTDQARSTDEALKMQIEDLVWLGLEWDEGPHPETLKDIGSHGPYRQSARLDIYKKHADLLIDQGKAYYCFMTDEEIEAQRAKIEASRSQKTTEQNTNTLGDESVRQEGGMVHIESPYENWSKAQALEELAKGKKAVVRFKTRNLKKDYIFSDLVRGEIKFPSDMVGDFVLLRSDGMPVYNFCNVVDDGLMKITHVLRAEEHLPNTLRQLMLYEAFGWKTPEFGHLSVVLGEDKQKLSKRHGATSCNQYKNMGYLPEALVNFIALCGWSSPEKDKELLSRDELIAQFGFDRLHSAGAVFDTKKFKWMNSVYLRNLPDEQIWKNLIPFFAREQFSFPKDPAWQVKSIQVFKPKMETFFDAIELYRPLSETGYVILDESKDTLSWESTKKVLELWKAKVASHPNEYLTEEEFVKAQDAIQVETGVKGKNLFMPIRVAVIGKPQGAELKILVPLLKKETLLKRVDQVLAKL